MSSYNIDIPQIGLITRIKVHDCCKMYHHGNLMLFHEYIIKKNKKTKQNKTKQTKNKKKKQTKQKNKKTKKQKNKKE
jgi:hypothetical protein